MKPRNPSFTALGCPGAELLAEFEAGRLPDLEFEALAEHLSWCPHCADRLGRKDDLTVADGGLEGRLRDCFGSLPLTDDFGSPGEGERGTTLDPETAALPKGIRNAARVHAADRVIGTMVGQNLVLIRIGFGGMGVVYRARHLGLNRPVALKTILAGHHAHPTAVARFIQEGQAIARLDHPNIIRVHDLGEHEGLPYIAMELVEGPCLRDKLFDQGPFEPRAAATLIRTLACAAGYAHRKGVIHRDLKPGNILFTQDGTPKVADFGLAKLLRTDAAPDSDATPTLTETGTRMGTLKYMAPEQASGQTREVGRAADVYALGVILYELLTGRVPFDGDEVEVLAKLRTAEPEPPSRLHGGIPQGLEAICLRCLEKDPARRYAGADELAADLDRWLSDEAPHFGLSGLTRAARRVRKHSTALLIAVLTPLIGLGLAALSRAHRAGSAHKALATIVRGLGAGKPVQLIDRVGRPTWSAELLAGSSLQRADPSRDNGYTVQSVSLALIELLPDPQFESYRLSARILHDIAEATGEAGLFVAHKVHRRNGQDFHLFSRISFNGVWTTDDRFRRKQRPEQLSKMGITGDALDNTAGLFVQLYAESRDRPICDLKLSLANGPPFKAPGEMNGQWHEVSIEVTPERIVGSWDGRKFPVPRETLRRELSLYPRIPPPPGGDPHDEGPSMELDPRGSLGLYVRQGLASFKDVTVTPILGNRMPDRP